jgi:cyclopropane fatty-acyl-phospholipid synthase-like methyltransferase
VKQNIYDVAGFFKSYQRMRNNQAGLNEIFEQLAMLSLLPDLKGLSILDLGCGAGELCRRMVDLGAKEVIGVDISRNMLELARKDVTSGVTFQNKAMEDLEFSPETFDLVVSSLAFHYVADLRDMFEKIYLWLKPAGLLLFSIEHPISTSSQGIHHGWIKDSSGHKLYWPVDCYGQEGIRESHWFIEGVIKYHRTISTIINTLINSGFTIKAMVEPVASEQDEREWAVLKEARRRPPFLIVKAVK